MPQLLIGLVLFIIILWIVAYLLSVAVVAAPAWIVGSGAGILARYLLQREHLNSPTYWNERLKGVCLQVEGQRLRWTAEPAGDDDFRWGSGEQWGGLLSGGVTGLLVLAMLHKGGAFQGLSFLDRSVGGMVNMVAGGILSLTIIVWAVLRVFPEERWQAKVRRHLEERVARVRDSETCLGELQAHVASIATHAEHLGLDWPTADPAFIQERVEARKADLLQGVLTFDQLFKEDLARLREEGRRLEKARAIHGRVLETLRQVTAELAPLGSRPLLDQLEILRGAVELAKKKHLGKREWSLFTSRLSEIEALARQLPNYAREGTGQDEEDTLTTAYRALGLSPETDAAQVRQRYLRLQKLLHTDRLQGESPEVRSAAEGLIKEINRAYEVIKKKGGV
jgi:DnaJ-domain-containing protein 1